MAAIRTTGQAMALGMALGAAPVALVHVPIFTADYRSGHQGQPKTIPTALGTMVVGAAGITATGAAVRSNTAAIKVGAALQGAGASFALFGGAAVLGYLLMDSRPHQHPAPPVAGKTR